MSVLGSIYQYMKADSELMAKIDNRLFTSWSIDKGFSRIILGFSTARKDEISRIGSLDVDIFYLGNQTALAQATVLRVTQILEAQTLTELYAGRTIRLYWQTEAIIPEDDPQVVHWSMKFDLTYIRNTLDRRI